VTSSGTRQRIAAPGAPGCFQLPAQLGDQGLQRGDPLVLRLQPSRLLTDQRVTRIPPAAANRSQHEIIPEPRPCRLPDTPAEAQP
jgi:hypothetical protein